MELICSFESTFNRQNHCSNIDRTLAIGGECNIKIQMAHQSHTLKNILKCHFLPQILGILTMRGEKDNSHPVCITVSDFTQLNPVYAR